MNAPASSIRNHAARAVVSRSGRGRMWAVMALTVVIVAVSVVMVRGNGFPGDTSAEAGFARDMSVHHEQAVEMAELIRGRADNPDVRALAVDITLTQQAQIGWMRGWLEVWGLPATGAEPAMAWMGMPVQGLMPGMASREQLSRLTELRGLPAERLFLQLMITHHEAGVHMAEAVLERTRRPEVRRLAEAMATSQRAEIGLMRKMLETAGGAAAPVPPTHTGHGGMDERCGHAEFVDGLAGRRGLRSRWRTPPALRETPKDQRQQQ
jgi:uncharacterized protein (DUF305 family)